MGVQALLLGEGFSFHRAELYNMRSRILPAVGISAIALVAAAAFAPGASASNAPSGAHFGKAGAAHYQTAKSCYSQGASLTGEAVASQDFEAAFDAYDNTAADDFAIKKACKIKKVIVTGQYSASGPAKAAQVTLYKDAGGKPGATIASKKAKVTADSAGTLGLKIKKGLKAPKGHSWISVQVIMDFGTSGQWYWAVATDGAGPTAQWQNPGGGFGVCPSWDAITTCNATVGTQLSFTLN